MSRKPILQIIVVDKSQSLCIFAQRRIPPAGKAAAVGRKVVDFYPKTVQFFAIVVEFSLTGGRPTLVSRRAHAHLRDTPSRTVPPPCRFPARKTAKRTFGGGGTRLIYIATRRSRKASCHSPRCPCPPLDAGQSCTERDRHTVSRSLLHGFALSAHGIAQPAPPLGTGRSFGWHRPSTTPPGRLPTQPVLPPRPPRSPKHGSRGRCPPLPSDSGV